MKSSFYRLSLQLEKLRSSSCNLSRIVDVELRSSEVSCFVDLDDLGIWKSITLMLNVEDLGWNLLLLLATSQLGLTWVHRQVYM